MSSPSRPAGKPFTTAELCILSLMGALIFAAKFALAAIPNVNLNTLLIILCVGFFGWKTLYAVAVYVLLEGLVFGFSVWWFSYLYVWPLIVVIAMLFRRNESVLLWAVVGGLCGLLFGPMMYLLYFTLFGWGTALSMWVAGIPYDLIHCVSNFTLILVLYRPLHSVFRLALTKGLERQ